MPIPTLISELSQTPASNYPTGSESPTSADGYFQTYAAFIATLRDGKGFTDPVQLASGATTDIGGQNAMFVEITGTTTITSFGSTYNGPRFLRFTGALTLTHNATTVNLPGAANIVTAAGDTAIAVPNQAGNGWNVVQFQRASAPPDIASGTVVATTSGTSVDFTSIPSGVKRITIQFVGVSTSGTSALMVQIGDSGGVETSGYLGTAGQFANAGANASVNYTTGFGAVTGLEAASVVHGAMTLTLQNAATFTWVASGTIGFSNATGSAFSAGSKSLTATLDRVRLTTVGGSDTFDAGSVNILWE